LSKLSVVQRGILPAMYEASAYNLLHSAFENGIEVIGSFPPGRTPVKNARLRGEVNGAG